MGRRTSSRRSENCYRVDSGFLLVDKGGGWTSHDVVAKVRNLAGLRKVGHAGTLDPMATGLLVLGLGRATRLMRFVQDRPKHYVAGVAFGVATDTLDADGAILDREPMPVSEEDVAEALPRFVGTIMQVPPMVSAIKMGGRRLYDLAREGKEVEREPRPVEVYRLELVDFSPGEYPEAVLEVSCGKGTYVRSLVADLARSLGGPAHLSALRRTRIGALDVAAAADIDTLAQAAKEDRLWSDFVLTPAAGLAEMPAVTVEPGIARQVSNGAMSPATSMSVPADLFRVLDGDGKLLAVYGVRGHEVAPEVVVA